MIAAKAIGKKRYAIRMGSRKTITVLMPLKADNLRPIAFEVACDHRSFALSGERLLVPDPALGVYVCRFRATTSQSECSGTLIARAGGEECRAEIRSLDELGSSITIKIEDISHGNQRYAWRRNVLEIAARHPSLHRYLGNKHENFPGQEQKHFRLLLAEIVADAVCARILTRNTEARPADYRDYDWDAYYAEYSKLATEFLPIAHASQLPNP